MNVSSPLPSPSFQGSSRDRELTQPVRSLRDVPITPGHRLVPVDRSRVDPALREAAEGMEALFLDYMMKVMRQTVPKSDMDLESPATEVYRSMNDSEVAKITAHAGGVGLADQIIAYLEASRYTLPRGDQGKVSPQQQDTGGSHEGRTHHE